MDAELAAQAEKAWDMLMRAQPAGQAPPDSLTGFMKLMHVSKNVSDRKLMKVMATFERGDVAEEKWAGPRGQITGYGIAKALVGLLKAMIAMGKNGFMAQVFMTQKGFDARFVTCLFVCGLIEHAEMSFQNLDLDAAEYVIRDTDGTGAVDLDAAESLVSAVEIAVPDVLDKFAFSPGRTPEPAEPYTTQLMRLLLAPVKRIDLHKFAAEDASALPGGADAVPANLFVADGAPTGDRVCILDALESAKWSDYLIRRHTITSKAELWYVFFMWLCRGPDRTVGSYGVKIGEYSCIFIYNLPEWIPRRTSRAELGTERESAMRKFIEQPCRAYTASLHALKIDTGDVVSKLETVGFNVIGLLYIHLLVMARVAAGVAARGPRRRFFTAPRAGERALVQDALCLTGETYGGIKATLPYMREAQAFPFVYQEAARRTQAIDRLAVAHLALMAEGDPENMDYAAGTVASTCRVRYAWVFEYSELLRGDTFKQEFRRRVGELEVDSPRMAVYKCIYDLIEDHLSGDEKAFYVNKFTAAATTGSAAPSRAESAGRAASGGGDGGDGGGAAVFSDRESSSGGSGGSESLYGRAGVGATGGAGGSSAVMSSLADMIQRLEEHASVESAVLDRHNEELKNNSAFSTYSKIDHERLLARLKAELGASQASLAAVIAEIKKLYDDMAAAHAESEKVQAAARTEHERAVGELQAQVDDLRTKLAACTLRAETLQGEKEGLERELAELRSRFAALEAENARLAAEVDEHKASHATLSGASDADREALTAKLAEQAEEIERLKLRVAGLEGELVALRLAHAATEGERAALATANAALVAELEGAKVAHLAALRASKKDAERLAAAHAREMEKLRLQNKQLRLDKEREETTNVENLRTLQASLEKHLKHATRGFNAEMRAVNATTAAANKGEKGLGLLTDMLRGGRVAEFYGGVVPAETVKAEYSLPALFLICESIAGTWKMNKAGPDETVAEKLAYDCRVYDSIDQGALEQSRINEYVSPLFQEFVAALKPGVA